YNGWHFILLKSIEATETRNYEGKINPEEMAWLQKDLASVADTTPIVVSIHIPLISGYAQWLNGGLAVNGRGSVITNGKEVLDLLKTKNLKLVLQGHLHCLEDYYVDGVHFITGGAVSASWWNGPLRGMEEGFLLIKVFGDDFQWSYIDYGWTPHK
ncbi:MAG: metallophosphoesterase, partial [Bacteroidales bacterium]|nr:metallophosphoesterase [Bacteroidales bacterium]